MSVINPVVSINPVVIRVYASTCGFAESRMAGRPPDDELQVEEGLLDDTRELEGGDGFYSLQVIEETLDSLNLSSNPALAERHRLQLEIEGEEEAVVGRGIVFSPGGDEAFMVTGATGGMSTGRGVGARPKTVGQSSEQAGGAAAAREPEEPGAGLQPSPRSQGGLTDRALSPSQASVTSLLSGTSTVSNAARRRGLEWDYSEDLGLEGPGSQGQAAASLSTLEKMAIGSYSEFLDHREEPEGRGEGREAGQAAGLPQAGQQEMLQGRMSKFADSLMRQRELQVGDMIQ
jgi:hypothetical protein